MSDENDTTQVVVPEQTTPAQVAAVDETLGKDGKPFDPARAQALIEKLKKDVAELKPKAQLADELTAKEKAKADAELTEAQRLTKQLEDERKENRNTRAENAALLAGLPKEFASRLQGDTKEALEADALEFAKFFPEKVTAQKIAPKINTTNPQGAQPNETHEQMRARVLGETKVNIFDPTHAREHGGGVLG